MSTPENIDPAEKPPVFPTWRRWYLVVLGFLLVQIIAYYWLTSLYS